MEFRLQGRRIRHTVAMPDRTSREFTHTAARGWPRSEKDAQASYEQACRQRWRALALVIKAKLEAIAVGITTIEEAFAAETVMPNGKTVAETVGPWVIEAYRLGQMPDDHPLLPAPLKDGVAR